MTKTQSLHTLLTRQWVSTLDAIRHCGITSLAQRVSEMRASGETVLDVWVQNRGSRYKVYRIAKPKPIKCPR